MGRLPAAGKLPAQQLPGQEGPGRHLPAQRQLAGQEEQRQRVAQPPSWQALGSVQVWRAPERPRRSCASGVSVLSGTVGMRAAAHAQAPMRERPRAR